MSSKPSDNSDELEAIDLRLMPLVNCKLKGQALLTTALKKMFDQEKMPVEHFTVHDLRRTL